MRLSVHHRWLGYRSSQSLTSAAVNGLERSTTRHGSEIAIAAMMPIHRTDSSTQARSRPRDQFKVLAPEISASARHDNPAARPTPTVRRALHHDNVTT